MGLDLVELVLAIEGSFGIHIPDADAELLETPRLVVDYLSAHLSAMPAAHSPPCLTQRAFYSVRAAAARRFGGDARATRPGTALLDVVGRRASEWSALGEDVRATRWPRLKGTGWRSALSTGATTFGDLASHLAVFDAAAVRGREIPWSRREIERLVTTIIEVELGVNMARFSLDSRFVRDMGLD